MSARWTQADVDAVTALHLRAFPSKYRNIKTGSYASKREAKRAEELKLMEAAGAIKNLREQVEFVLIPKQDGERACKYVADFVYDEPCQYTTVNVVPTTLTHTTVVEDTKGYRTALYRIKRKLMLSVHGFRIREV